MTSPSYGISQYPNNTDCTYKMTSIDGYGLKLVFNVFDLENSTGCENDNVTVYRGIDPKSNPMIAKRCGKMNSDLASTSTQLSAKFVTNSYVSSVGFNMTVFGKPCFISYA